MKYLDLFSGIGGFALGAYWAGWRFDEHYFSEIEPYCVKLYQQRFPDAIGLGDIREIDCNELSKGEWFVTGGFPCQDISIAGKGKGIKGKRSGLWFEMWRVIRDLQPRWVIAENVGALTFRGLAIVLNSLAEIGYDCEWTDIRASDVGAPHRRERIWIVAYPQQSASRRDRTSNKERQTSRSGTESLQSKHGEAYSINTEQSGQDVVAYPGGTGGIQQKKIKRNTQQRIRNGSQDVADSFTNRRNKRTDDRKLVKESQNVADSQKLHEGRLSERTSKTITRFKQCCKNVCNTSGQGLQNRITGTLETSTKRIEELQLERSNWWATLAEFRGIFDGISKGLDKTQMNLYNGNHANAKKIRSGKTVPLLRPNIGEKKDQQPPRRSSGFYPSGLLQSYLHGFSLSEKNANTISNSKTICASPAKFLRALQQYRKSIFASRRWKLAKQRNLQFADAVRFLSYFLTPFSGRYSTETNKIAMLCLRETILQTWAVFYSSYSHEEAWQSLSEKEKDWSILATYFGPFIDEWPDTPRTSNNIPERTSRLRCLGNSIVPQIAEMIFRQIMETDNA